MQTFKRLQTDSDDKTGRLYALIANVKDIAHLFDDWRMTNLSPLDVDAAPARAIRQTLIDEPANFHFLNRGLTLMAKDMAYDNYHKTVSITFVDPKVHGLIDGEHTYQILCDFIDQLEYESRTHYVAYVCLEVMEGIEDQDFMRKIVGARNTSLPVTEQSLAKLTGRLDLIESVLSGQPYEYNIYYQPGDEQSWDCEPSNIDIRDILSYLICFDAESFPDDLNPIIAYSSKEKVADHYVNRYEAGAIQKYLPLLPEVLELHDVIYKELPEFYNQSGSRFGDLKGVVSLASTGEDQTVHLNFIQQASSYIIPSAYIYPLLAAFRKLVHVESDGARWTYEPRKFFREIGAQLAERLSEQASELHSPADLGKKSAFWRACLNEVKIHLLEKKTER